MCFCTTSRRRSMVTAWPTTVWRSWAGGLSSFHGWWGSNLSGFNDGLNDHDTVKSIFFLPTLSAVYPHHVPTMFYADQTNKHGGILGSWWGCIGDNKLDNDLTRMISGFTALRNRDSSGNKSGSKQIGIKVFYCGWFKHPGIKCFFCSF